MFCSPEIEEFPTRCYHVISQIPNMKYSRQQSFSKGQTTSCNIKYKLYGFILYSEFIMTWSISFDGVFTHLLHYLSLWGLVAFLWCLCYYLFRLTIGWLYCSRLCTWLLYLQTPVTQRDSKLPSPSVHKHKLNVNCSNPFSVVSACIFAHCNKIMHYWPDGFDLIENGNQQKPRKKSKISN